MVYWSLIVSIEIWITIIWISYLYLLYRSYVNITVVWYWSWIFLIFIYRNLVTRIVHIKFDTFPRTPVRVENECCWIRLDPWFPGKQTLDQLWSDVSSNSDPFRLHYGMFRSIVIILVDGKQIITGAFHYELINWRHPNVGYSWNWFYTSH